MGKRKRHDEDYHLVRKIRKLERKVSRARRRRRHRSSSSGSSAEYSDYDRSDHSAGYDDQESSPEASHPEGALFYDTVIVPDTEKSNMSTSTAGPSGGPSGGPVLDSVVVPVNTGAPPSTPSSTPAIEPPSTEPIDKLQPQVLCLLGDEPIKEQEFGAVIHKDIASRWSDILVNGMKEETKKGITSSYDVPENLKLAQAPALNAEIKAAINENALKRDCILVEKQKILCTGITCLANTMSTVLADDYLADDTKNYIVKSLSDTGRLLCQMHYSETQTRRSFALACLNKDIKDNIKDLKRDNLLFGSDLQENLKSMKAITKVGTEIKHTVPKAKLPPKNKPDPTTVRALNWRGPPPPPAPPPRRTQARPISTAGGRRQQPPATARRANDKRASRHYSRTSRR